MNPPLPEEILGSLGQYEFPALPTKYPPRFSTSAAPSTSSSFTKSKNKSSGRFGVISSFHVCLGEVAAASRGGDRGVTFALVFNAMANPKGSFYTTQLFVTLTAGDWASESPSKGLRRGGLSWPELLRKYRKHQADAHCML